MRKIAADFLQNGADTYRERNKVYGDNYKRVGEAMRAMFPEGVALVSADDHNRFQIFNLIMVKLSRYCVNWSKGGHADSIHDAMVYCAMLEDIDAEIAGRPPFIPDDANEVLKKLVEGDVGKPPHLKPEYWIHAYRNGGVQYACKQLHFNDKQQALDWVKTYFPKEIEAAEKGWDSCTGPIFGYNLWSDDTPVFDDEPELPLTPPAPGRLVPRVVIDPAKVFPAPNRDRNPHPMTGE